MTTGLGRAHELLSAAEMAQQTAGCYRNGLLAARQAAVALLADEQVPSAVVGPVEVWALLAARHPGLGEWAGYFALSEGNRHPSRRQADDLVRAVPVFLALIEHRVRVLAGGRVHG